MNIYSEYLARIEAVLTSVLPNSVDAHWLSRVSRQNCPDGALKHVDEFLEPGRTLLKRGGKRWRPLVTILTCEALGGGRKADILAPLTEIPHNGSLIIDDIEDSSLTRRGARAIHLEFGTDLAVNMGNLMYFLPTIVLERTDFDSASTMAILMDWLTIMRRLHLGQGYDIVWHRDKTVFPDRDAYLRMCRFKTGSLSSLAARLGVRAAFTLRAGHHKDPFSASPIFNTIGVPTKTEDDMVEMTGDVWEEIGTGFQILDDVQNLVSGIPGKDMGDDIVEGKKSLPVILHIERHPEDGKRLVELFSKSAELVPLGDWTPVTQAITLLKKSNAIDSAQEMGKNMLDSGRRKLLTLLPESSARDLLITLVDGFLNTMTLGESS